MFTMSHKALVLNTLRAEDVGNITATQCTILGFCDFDIASARGNASAGGSAFGAASVPGVNASADYTPVVPANAVVGDSIQVEVTFVQNRYVSEYSSDFIKPGDTIIFQSAPLASLDAVGVRDAVVAGWLAYLDVFNVAQDPPLVVSNGAGGAGVEDINVTMQADYLIIDSVVTKLVPRGAKVAPAAESTLAIAAGDPYGVEGIGQGKFLEESIRTANYTNQDPYAVKPNGSDSVDIRGSYKLYEFQAKDNGGWEPHEHLGIAVADQEVKVKYQKFTIYANEQDSALITALDLWIAAVIAA